MTTFIQIQITPDQLEELIERAVQKRLDTYRPPMPEKPLPEMLTRKQTCELLQISPSTLHEWGHDRADRPALLVPRRIGTQVRYPKADVLRLAKENRKYKHNH